MDDSWSIKIIGAVLAVVVVIAILTTLLSFAIDPTREINAKLDDIREETENVDFHLHAVERWFGIAVPQVGDTTWGDTGSLVPYVAVSGNGLFGDAVQIIGTTDTPILAGQTVFGMHRVTVIDLDNITSWYFRVIWGTGTIGDAETADQFTEFVLVASFTGPPIRPQGIPIVFDMPDVPVGTKVWIKVKNATNLDEIDFFIGVNAHHLH